MLRSQVVRLGHCRSETREIISKVVSTGRQEWCVDIIRFLLCTQIKVF